MSSASNPTTNGDIMQTIERLILTSLPTIPYNAKASGSLPIEILDSSWDFRPPTAREASLRKELKQLERDVKLHGCAALEGLTPEMITFEADLSWREALGDSIPSREELERMSEDANASDDLSLAIRYLDPPRNATSMS